MQQLKLIDKIFFFFPKHQQICLAYSDIKILNHRLFKSLSIQVSSKNTLLFRLRKSLLGHLLFRMIYRKRTTSILVNNNIKLGYLSNGKMVLFEFDELNNPVFVFKQKKSSEEFKKESFLGYTLIEEYSTNEYFKKRSYIESALKENWSQAQNGIRLHGDFTHLNILINSKKELVFIDEKNIENSPIFDVYYFQSYYFKCLDNCSTINNREVALIKKDFKKIVKSLFIKIDKEILIKYLNSIDNRDSLGLKPEEIEKYMNDFKASILN